MTISLKNRHISILIHSCSCRVILGLISSHLRSREKNVTECKILICIFILPWNDVTPTRAMNFVSFHHICLIIAIVT